MVDGTVTPQRNRAAQRLALLLLIGAVAVILALESWQVWRNYQNAFASARSDVGNIALAAAQHADDAIKEADSLLVSIRDRLEDQPLDELDRPRVHRLLARQAALLPQLHGLFIYDRDGSWRMTDKSSTPPPASNADREYFQFHRQHREDQLHVGAVIESRSTHELIIPVSRRLEDREGRFAGVLLATIRLQYFIDYYARFRLDARGAISLALEDGTLMVRRPYDPQHIGTTLADGELFRQYVTQAANGTALVRALIDGQERLYAFQRLEGYPLVALAGISKGDILASWRQDMLRSVIVVGIIIVGMLIFGFSLLREIRASLRSEAALRQAHDDLHLLTLKDSLTGLGNRRQFDTLLPVELARAQRNHQPLSLLMIDIDHFKAYNDHYGHPAGDRCLQAVAGVVASAARRPGDLAVRYGGEEMALLLPNCDAAGAQRVAHTVQERLQMLEVPHATSPFGRITVSLGFAVQWPGQPQPPLPAELLASADAALYRAKHLGRNRTHPSPDAADA
ncbi:GGDEF domain-containing protein [Pseudomonas oryzihabitans]|uniref:GGDEF domain-containing protein n=1 Tax=Pseudomonas oryzihabitans TaxID=47885 RepID=UPI0011A32FAA|nr:sensor domain-containing diguanylate cyclase [Pseudomonas psychrotolerans]